MEVRCPGCTRLLFVVNGNPSLPGWTVEIKCPSCKELVVWPVLAAERAKV